MVMPLDVSSAPVPPAAVKTVVSAMPTSPTAKGLPSLLNQRRVGVKAAQGRMAAPQLGRLVRRLPAIMEVDCEDDEEGTLVPAVHVPAARPARPECLPPSTTDPLCLAAAASSADVVVTSLKEGNRIQRAQLLAWLVQSMAGAALTLASSEHGSRVVQAALEVAAGTERNMLVAELEGSVVELAMSQHGHEVLTRLVEVMPTCTTLFVIKELQGCCKTIARHRYGCEVLNLMIMHFSEAQMTELIDEVLQDTTALSKHEHGSGVLQHLLEYGALVCQQRIVQCLLPEVHSLAMDKNASHVLQQIVGYCELDEQFALANALLGTAKVSLTDIACSRCGSAVLRDLAGAGICVEELQGELTEGLVRLNKSKYGRRVLTALGLDALPCTAVPTLFATCGAAALPQHWVAVTSSRDVCWHAAAAA